MAYNIVLSCSHGDMPAAESLKAALAGRGNEVWMPWDESRPGERWAEQIRERLHAADVVILLIGKEPDREVRNEWSLVLQETYRRSDPVQVVPVLLPGAEPPSFVDVQAIQVDGEPIAWEEIAQQIEAPGRSSFHWKTTDRARSELSERLDRVEKLARTLPGDAYPTS